MYLTRNLNGQETIDAFNYEYDDGMVVINGDVTKVEIKGDTMWATFNGVVSELHRQ